MIYIIALKPVGFWWKQKFLRFHFCFKWGLTCHRRFLGNHKEAERLNHFCSTGPGSRIRGGEPDLLRWRQSCRCSSCPSTRSPATSCSPGCRCRPSARSQPCSPPCDGFPCCGCPSRGAPKEVLVPFHLLSRIMQNSFILPSILPQVHGGEGGGGST